MAVLATLILLTYTNVIRAIVLTLIGVSLLCTSGGGTRLVWYIDGTVNYFSLQHTLLFLVAFGLLLLAVPYTFVLLFDALIEKHLTKVRLFQKWWIKFKPFIDAYNGPYKDRCRFWTGLLLLARLVLASVASSGAINPNYLVVALDTIAVLLLSLMVIFKGIYQKKHLNVLECWSLLNLAVVSSFAAATQTDVVVKISVGLMFATFIATVFFTTHSFDFEVWRVSGNFGKIKWIKHNDIQNNERVASMEVSLMSTESPTPIEMCLRTESLIEVY